MSSVAEIEAAVSRLSPGEFKQLAQWFDEQRNQQWDRHIEEDAKSGKLREAYKRLQSENARN